MTNSKTGARKVQNDCGKPHTKKQEKSQKYFVKGCVIKTKKSTEGALTGQIWDNLDIKICNGNNRL